VRGDRDLGRFDRVALAAPASTISIERLANLAARCDLRLVKFDR
jgi:hypothetical protein